MRAISIRLSHSREPSTRRLFIVVLRFQRLDTVARRRCRARAACRRIDASPRLPEDRAGGDCLSSPSPAGPMLAWHLGGQERVLGRIGEPLSQGGIAMHRFIVGLLAVLVLAGAGARAEVPSTRLDDLFRQLAAAADAQQAQTVEVQIRRIWSETGDATLDKLMTAGQDAMIRRETAAALAAFDALLSARPDHAEAHLRRAQVLIMMGEVDRALADAEAALAREPRHFRALQALGLIHAARGEAAAALDAYRRALALNPNLAVVRQQIERLQGAETRRQI
jgi:Tfp pilus assembly protein PilF